MNPDDVVEEVLGSAELEDRALERLVFEYTAARLALKVVVAAIFLAVGALLAFAGCSNRADVKSQILKLDAEWSQAAQARDVDRAVSYWSDDAVVFPPGEPAVSGKAAIRAFVVKSFATPGFQISWKTTNVTASADGTMAYATGTNRVSFDGADGKKVTIDGKAVTVWRREKDDGAWKCVIDIWNDAAPPAP